jgi:hypothetical protein
MKRVNLDVRILLIVVVLATPEMEKQHLKKNSEVIQVKIHAHIVFFYW